MTALIYTLLHLICTYYGVVISMTLAKKTTIGVLWNFTEQLSKRGIGILITLLLARFLTPSDYGLIGMMALFIAIANELMDSGFKIALIRKSDATQADFNTVFYANIALGMLSYFLLFCLAPLISAFYEEPRLTILIRTVGIIIIINSFQIVQSAILSRNLNFKAQLQATVPATIISGLVAVAMAYNGFGVWSLIAQMIVSSLSITVFLWSMNLWRPKKIISRSSLNEMFSFGSKLFLSNLINIAYLNMYIVVIAKIFTTSVAGHYFFARKIREIALNQLVKSIQTVTFPALVTLQTDDATLKIGYKKVIYTTTFLIFPIMAFVAALAEPFFILFLNEQWLPAVPYLQMMCISGLMYPLHSINLNILQVKGRSDLFLYLEIIKKIMSVIIFSLSIPYGVMGILLGQIVSSVLSYIPNSYFSGKLLDYSAKEQIFDFFPALVLSGTIAILVYLSVSIFSLSPLFQLLIFGFLAWILYFVVSYIAKLDAIILVEQLIRSMFKGS